MLNVLLHKQNKKGEKPRFLATWNSKIFYYDKLSAIFVLTPVSTAFLATLTAFLIA